MPTQGKNCAETEITRHNDGLGSGTDSISFLKSMPVDGISLENIFLICMEESTQDRDILAYLVRLAGCHGTHINTHLHTSTHKFGGMIMFKAFKVKDIIFLAVLAAVTTLFGGLAMPVMRSEVFGLQTLVTCLFYSLFAVIGIQKIHKTGTLTLFGLFTGFPLLFMAPVMFFNNFIGALIAEFITLLIFRSYEKKSAVICASSLFMILTVPLSLPFSIWLNGSSYTHFVNTQAMITVLVCVGVVVLSVAGSLIGYKVAQELQKAGKLRPYEDA